MVTTEELLAWVPASLQGSEAEDEFWRGVLGPAARVETYFELRRDRLAWLMDPSLCPDDYVRHLAALVGLDARLPAAREADVATLRRLIPIAVELWRTKGTPSSWRAVVRQISGRAALILGWRELWAVDGTPGELHMLPDPGTAPGGAYDYPETVLDVWVDDPDDEIDLDVVAAWIEAVRPAQRRVNLRRALLVEDALEGLTRWEWTGSVTYSESARTLTLAAGAVASPIRAADGPAVHLYVVGTWTGTSRLYVLGDADDGYALDVDWTDGAAQIERVVGGVGTPIASDTWPVADGQRYQIRFEAIANALSTTIRARFEGLVLEAIDTNAARHLTGSVALGAGTGPLVVEAALAYALPADTVRVGPSP